MEPAFTTNSSIPNKYKASYPIPKKSKKASKPSTEPNSKPEVKPQKAATNESLNFTAVPAVEEVQKFRDPEFPADLNSLIGKFKPKELSAQGNSMKWWSKLVWLRLDDIYGKNNYRILNDDIKPSDIVQGDISDCWIRASLSALAEYPRRIRDLFKSVRVSREGFYEIWICDMGVWRLIKIDDYIPCCPKTKKPIFASGSRNGVWAELIHKVLAKLYGCYANLIEGLCSEAFHNLTGAPTVAYYVDGKDRKEVINSILDGEERMFVMTCGSRDEEKYGVEAAGLVECHAYSLLGVINLQDADGKKIPLLKLRNPYGDRESTENWNGAWSAKSSKWTPDLKKQVDFDSRDEGIFYMSFEDFFEYFFLVEICKVRDSFKHSSLKLSTDIDKEFLFKVSIPVKGNYYFTVHQQNSRKYTGDDNDYEYSEVTLALMDKTNSNYHCYIRKTDMETWIYVELNAGDYNVYTKLNVEEGEVKEFSLSCYGPGEANIQRSLEPIKKKKKLMDNKVKKEEKDKKEEKHEDSFDDDEDGRRGKGKRKGKGSRRK